MKWSNWKPGNVTPEVGLYIQCEAKDLSTGQTHHAEGFVYARGNQLAIMGFKRAACWHPLRWRHIRDDGDLSEVRRELETTE